MASANIIPPTSILQLPDDCLYFIFQRLNAQSDRESFGLTCHRWLNIQNSSRRSLEFQCSFKQLSIGSLSGPPTNFSSFHLYKLLERFQCLQSLSLAGCTELLDTGISVLPQYGRKIERLNLDCCFGITDHGLSTVASGCHSLVIISLYRCNVTDLGIETLAKSRGGLKGINLTHCALVSDHGISALSQNCRSLCAIKISRCKSITGIGFQGCSETLTYLEAETCNLKAEGLSSMVSGGGVEYLDISNVSWCIGQRLTPIDASYISKLKVLNFRLCRTIGDGIVIAIAKGCPLLCEWNLAVCHEVGIAGWESIGSNCHNLVRLHVNRCQNLCDQGLQALRDGCRGLEQLYLSGNRHISSLAIEMFKCSRSDVKIVDEEIPCVLGREERDLFHI